jgi:hypothetical protein
MDRIVSALHNLGEKFKLNSRRVDEFALKTLEITIKVPDGIEIRYLDKTGEELAKEYNVIGLSTLNTNGKNLIVEISYPDENYLAKRYAISQLVKEIFLEYAKGHEDAHALQKSHNYQNLVDFVEEYVGKTEYLTKMRKIASDFDDITDFWIQIHRNKLKTETILKLVNNEFLGVDLREVRLVYKQPIEQIEKTLESHADMCSVANLIRKSYLSLGKDLNAEKIVRENFSFSDVTRYFK